MKRTITHWTGGGWRANEKDRRHYHLLTEVDGNVVRGKEAIEDNIVTADGDYAAHTLNLNAGSIGVAMCGMHGATEVPYDPGEFPISERQFEKHCMMLAELHAKYAIPISRETCLTHAEVEPTLGVKQNSKWDLTRLPFRPELRGAIPVGDYMRERVSYYQRSITGEDWTVPQQAPPTLRMGSPHRALVEGWQRSLRDLGYFLGGVDGLFGTMTKKATVMFQEQNGLVADGIVGPKTWAAMEGTPRPFPHREHVSTKSLREAGSRTIRAADKTKAAQIVAGSAGVATLTAEIKAARDGIQEVSTGVSASGTLSEIMPWAVILLTLAAVGAAAYAWWQQNRVQEARTEDAQTGAHLGR